MLILGQTPEEGGNIPAINGHDFLTITGLEYPFLNTSFQTNIGIGSTQEITFEQIIFDTLEIEGVAGAVLFANLGLNYNQKIKDWLAFRFRYNFAARVGTEAETLLTHGVNTLGSAELSWFFRLKRHQKYLLSLSTTVSNGEASFISVSAFIRDIVNKVPTASVSKSVPTLTGTFALHWAYAISTVVGLVVDTGIGYGETLVRGESGALFHLGGGLNFNLYRRYGIPIGTAVGFVSSRSNQLLYAATMSSG